MAINSNVMSRIRAHRNVGTNALPQAASGYVSAVGELIPFPSTSTLGPSSDVVTIGRGGLVVLIAMTGVLVAFTVVSRKYQGG